MLEVRDLWFGYEGEAVLKGVSLEAGEGVTCLLGPNGAGKTTLIKCILGILRPWRGLIRFMGRNLLNMDPMSRARLVSYVPQEFSIKFPYSVLDVVLMGRNPHVNLLKGPSDEDVEAAWKALRRLGIESLATRAFTDLSGGEKRLALIARALAQGGKLMVLDEPTAFLDFRNQVKVLRLIREVSRSEGKLILTSLHDPNAALTYCDRVCVLNGGEVVASGSPSDVINEDLVERVYGVRVEFTVVRGRKVLIPFSD